MRLYLIILILFCYSKPVIAQGYDIAFDINDYKHTINFDNHKVVFQVKPVKDLKTTDPMKKYYWYGSHQIKITQGSYSGKLLNGVYSEFYPNNNLKESGFFVKGLKHGEWNNWNEESVLVERKNYKKGVLEGQFFVFDKFGKLSETGLYKVGELNGSRKVYHGQDSVTISTYRNGKLVEPSKSWIKNFFTKKKQ